MASLGEHLVSVCLGTRQMGTSWEHIKRAQPVDEPAATGKEVIPCSEGGQCGLLDAS